MNAGCAQRMMQVFSILLGILTTQIIIAQRPNIDGAVRKEMPMAADAHPGNDLQIIRGKDTETPCD